MLNDLPKRDWDVKLNWTTEDSFKQDLKKVLDALELLCMGKGSHRDYVAEHNKFMSAWAPRD